MTNLALLIVCLLFFYFFTSFLKKEMGKRRRHWEKRLGVRLSLLEAIWFIITPDDKPSGFISKGGF